MGMGAVDLSTLVGRVASVLGQPKKVTDAGRMDAVVDDGIDTVELSAYWGLTAQEVNAMAPEGSEVNAADGLSLDEIEALEAAKKEAVADFVSLFKGSGKTEEQLEALFDEIWELKAAGNLDRDAWDDLMGKYGLEKAKMKADITFEELIGYTNLGDALANLVLTARFYSTSDDPRHPEKKELGYYTSFAYLCTQTKFSIFKLDEVDGLTRDVLDKLKKTGSLNIPDISDEDLFAKINEGEFGEYLQNAAEGAKNYREVLIAILVRSHNGIGQDPEIINDRERETHVTGRMKDIAEIIGRGPSDPKRLALVDQIAAMLKEKQLFIDYSAINDAEVKK